MRISSKQSLLLQIRVLNNCKSKNDKGPNTRFLRDPPLGEMFNRSKGVSC